MRGRRLIIELSALVSTLLSATCIAVLGNALAEYAGGAEFWDVHRPLFVVMVVLPTVSLGIGIGIVIWVVSLRPYVSLDEMVAVMRHPGTPDWLALLLERGVRWAYCVGKTSGPS